MSASVACAASWSAFASTACRYARCTARRSRRVRSRASARAASIPAVAARSRRPRRPPVSRSCSTVSVICWLSQNGGRDSWENGRPSIDAENTGFGRCRAATASASAICSAAAAAATAGLRASAMRIASSSVRRAGTGSILRGGDAGDRPRHDQSTGKSSHGEFSERRGLDDADRSRRVGARVGLRGRGGRLSQGDADYAWS